MDLRPQSIRVALERRRSSATAACLLALGASLLALGTGGARAGLSDYPATLYLSGSGASIGSAYKLVASAGVSTTARPAPAIAANGAGNLGAA